MSIADALLARTVELVDIASESFAEADIATHVEAVLGACPHLQVERVGDNVVARTALGRPQRLVLAGHIDTVPANGNTTATVRDGVVWGLGSADMKSGLAVMVELARALSAAALDATYVFYAREEVAGRHSGLEELFVVRPDLLTGDAAILGEPTAGRIEAGCQGTLRAVLRLAGQRAHTARPWMGRNAIHRLAPILTVLGEHHSREPMVGGLRFREALQAVSVTGGVAGNVVPDAAELTLNHRFAPDRSVEQAYAAVMELLAPHVGPGDELTLVESSPAGVPAADHPLLSELVTRSGAAVEPKLGWTDVARFSARGVAAVNFGPGDPTLAHRADERVEARAIVWVHDVLAGLLTADA